MTVFIVGYKGTDTDEIIGVYTDIEKAKEVMHKDYEKTEFGYVPNEEYVEDNHIYISKTGDWYDEWYIVEKELDSY